MKIRTDFVTNSSSSSFILAFNTERDIANDICDQYMGEFLGQLMCDVKNSENHLSVEELIKEYKEAREWYPIRYNVKKKLQTDLNMSIEEFISWEKDNMEKEDKLVEEELNREIDELLKNIKGKEIISKVYYEDSYPEVELYDACAESKNLIAVFRH